MKVVVTSQGEDLSSKVDPRFGRAAFFIVYQTADDSFEVLANAQNINAAQGAGVKAVETVAACQPDLVVSGNFGPKAITALTAAGIKAATWSQGTVAEAIELAKNDKLEVVDSANVEGHWK